MADSLLDQIRQNLSKMSQPVQPAGSVLGQTDVIQRVSQAASGKAAPTATEGPARSRQAELAVVDQVQRGQAELNKAAQMQDLAFAQQQKSIKDSEQFKNKLLSEEQLNVRDKFLITQQTILNDYANGRRQLDFNKDKAKLEQIGFSARLSNDKYLQELEKQATLANLSDALSFEEELTRTIFADEEELLRDDLEFRSIMSADSRQFAEEMAKMDINTATKIAEAQNKALSERQVWEGVSGMVQAAPAAYSRYGGNSSPEPYRGSAVPTAGSAPAPSGPDINIFQELPATYNVPRP